MTKPEIRKELENWLIMFDEAYALLDDPNNSTKLSSEKYSSLKEIFKSRFDEVSKSKWELTASRNASAFYAPAIRDVYLHCKARIGTMNRQELISSLYDGHDYLSYWISQIDS